MASDSNKRNDFCVGDKIQLLKQFDSLPPMSQHKAAQTLGVSQPLLSRLLKQRKSSECGVLHTTASFRKRRRFGKDRQVEEALKQWYVENRTKETMCRRVLRQKAENLAVEMGRTGFVATDGWFSRWTKRENIILHRQKQIKEPPKSSETENNMQLDECSFGEIIPEPLVQAIPTILAQSSDSYAAATNSRTSQKRRRKVEQNNHLNGIEFDTWCQSLASQLNSMEPQQALSVQVEIEELISKRNKGLGSLGSFEQIIVDSSFESAEEPAFPTGTESENGPLWDYSDVSIKIEALADGNNGTAEEARQEIIGGDGVQDSADVSVKIEALVDGNSDTAEEARQEIIGGNGVQDSADVSVKIEALVDGNSDTAEEARQEIIEGDGVQDSADGDRHFILSLMDDLSRIPSKNKIDAKIDVMLALRKWCGSSLDVAVEADAHLNPTNNPQGLKV